MSNTKGKRIIMSLREAMEKRLREREKRLMGLFTLIVVLFITLTGFTDITKKSEMQIINDLQVTEINNLQSELNDSQIEIADLLNKNKILSLQYNEVTKELEKTKEDIDNLIALYVPNEVGYVAERASLMVSVTNEEVEMLERITEAEATGEGFYGKRLVSNVIINRVLSSDFPNTIKEVIFQSGQFSPITDGRYKSIKVTNETKIGRASCRERV